MAETEKEVKPKAAKKVAGSEEKKAFALMMENYKTQNPAKYELKKEALEAKLALL